MLLLYVPEKARQDIADELCKHVAVSELLRSAAAKAADVNLDLAPGEDWSPRRRNSPIVLRECCLGSSRVRTLPPLLLGFVLQLAHGSDPLLLQLRLKGREKRSARVTVLAHAPGGMTTPTLRVQQGTRSRFMAPGGSPASHSVSSTAGHPPSRRSTWKVRCAGRSCQTWGLRPAPRRRWAGDRRFVCHGDTRNLILRVLAGGRVGRHRHAAGNTVPSHKRRWSL